MRLHPLSALILIPLALCILSSCRQESPRVRSTMHLKMMDDTLIRYNRGVVRDENQEILDYTERHGWDVKTTPSGLRYLIYKPGDGPAATRGRIAVIRYSVQLLDGTHVYSSDSLGPREFEIDHGGVEPGLEEGILLMHQGGRAKLILPPHLAFGLLGDDHRIPPGATLVYDVELVDLKNPPKSLRK